MSRSPVDNDIHAGLGLADTLVVWVVFGAPIAIITQPIIHVTECEMAGIRYDKGRTNPMLE